MLLSCFLNILFKQSNRVAFQIFLDAVNSVWTWKLVKANLIEINEDQMKIKRISQKICYLRESLGINNAIKELS